MRYVLAFLLGLAAAVVANATLALEPHDAGGTYLGVERTKYPASNDRPAAHLVDGLEIAQAIRDETGAIGIITAGHSLTNDWAVGEDGTTGLKALLASDPRVSARVQLVDLSVNAAELNSWLHPDGYPWDTVDALCAAAGWTEVSRGLNPSEWLEPRVILVNQGIFQRPAGPQGDMDYRHYKADFPGPAIITAELTTAYLAVMKRKFPNLELAFVTTLPSLEYNARPPDDLIATDLEVYEFGFGVKLLVEKVIANPVLYTQGTGTTAAIPYVTWGPLFWSCGSTPNGDGIAWVVGDFEPDGVHLSAQGEAKAASLWLEFLLSDPIARLVVEDDGSGPPPPPPPPFPGFTAWAQFETADPLEAVNWPGNAFIHGKANNLTVTDAGELLMRVGTNESGGLSRAVLAGATEIVFELVSGAVGIWWQDAAGSWSKAGTESTVGTVTLAIPAGAQMFTLGYDNTVEARIDDLRTR